MKINLSLLLIVVLWLLTEITDPPPPYFGMQSARCDLDGDKLINCTLYEGKTVTDLMNEWKGLYDDKDCDDSD